MNMSKAELRLWRAIFGGLLSGSMITGIIYGMNTPLEGEMLFALFTICAFLGYMFYILDPVIYKKFIDGDEDD